MQRRSLFSILAVSAAVLLLVGLGGVYWLFNQSPLSVLRGSMTTPSAAMFVPKQAPVMASLLVNPERLDALGKVIASTGKGVDLTQFKQSLLANTNLDYERDVQPWLGDEITLAVTTPDIDRDRSNGQQPGYLLAIATQDAARSREFLQLFWQKQAIAGTELVFEQYKGVKLISSSTTPTTMSRVPHLATAAVGNQFILFANHPKVLRDAINNVQAPDLSLQETPQYQQALQQFTQGRLGLVFLNVPQLAEQLNPPSENPVPASTPVYETMGLSLSLNRQGLMAETALLTATGQTLEPRVPTLEKPVGALQYIPASTPFVAGSTELDHLWASVNQAFTGYDAIAEWVNTPVDRLETRWGIDLAKDIFAWAQGEYALGLLPHPGQTQPDWIFVAARSPEAIAGIEQLDTIAKAQGLSIGPLTLNNQQVSAWTKLSAPANPADPRDLKAKVQGVHATAGNYEIFTTSVEAMEQALKAPTDSLLNSKKFQQAIAAFPEPNQGYFYLDWEQGHLFLERQIPLLPFIELAGKPFFNHLRSLTISSYGSTTEASRGAVLVKLS